MGRNSGSETSERSMRWKADLFENVNKKWDEGMTYNEIAEHFGITANAVKSKIRGRLRNTPGR